MNYKECPIVRTLEVIGGKWKPIILHYLSEAPRRSGELGRLIPQASGKMLTQQLRELEADKIIRRKIYRQVPPKVEYILTPLGESLRPVMLAMCAWGEANAQSEDVEGGEDRAHQNLAGMGLPTSRDSVFQPANSFAKKRPAKSSQPQLAQNGGPVRTSSAYVRQ
jgi:DNA-binding HxlR family transcriptional regulator